LTSAVIATPGMSRCRKRERRRSIRSGSRSLSPGPRPLRTARASFPACRSSRLTCGDAGRSEDPKAQALDSPFRRGPIDLGPVHAWRATVFRCLRRPYRADRVYHCLSFVSSYSTRGKSAPFQVGSLHPQGVALSLRLPEGLRFLAPPLPPGHWPALRQVESACPTTHGAYRVPPAGESNALGSPSAPVGLCPIDGQTTELPILPTYHFGSGLSAALACSTSRGLEVFTMLPIALFLSPGVQMRLPGVGTFLHASHLPVTRDARCR
jgi:hypothetical protein